MSGNVAHIYQMLYNLFRYVVSIFKSDSTNDPLLESGLKQNTKLTDDMKNDGQFQDGHGKSIRKFLSRDRLPEILQLFTPELDHEINVEDIKALIEKDKTCVKYVDERGHDTVLHRYLENIDEKLEKHWKLLDFVIHNGANVNAVNINLETPLHIAAKNNKFQTVRYLILNNADASLYNSEENSCLHLAVQLAYVETVAILHEFAGDKLDEKHRNKHQLTALDLAQKIEYNDNKIKMQKILEILEMDPSEYKKNKGHEKYLQEAVGTFWPLQPTSYVFNTYLSDNAKATIGTNIINGKDAAIPQSQNLTPSLTDFEGFVIS